MSLTKINESSLLYPSGNPVYIIFSSSDSGQDGFRYKVELYDIDNTKIIDTLIHPDTNNNNYLVYDFSMILNDKFINDYNTFNTEEITYIDGGVYPYRYTITEYIGQLSGSTYSNMYKYTFNGITQYGEDFIYDDYMLDGINKKFLTLKNKRKYRLDEYGTLNMFYGNYNTSNIVKGKIKVETHNTDGISTYYFDKYSLVLPINGINVIPIGPKQLNIMATNGDIDRSNGTPTNSNIIHGYEYPSETLYYNITFCDINKVEKSETIRVDVDLNCYKHKGVQFLYLDNLGSYETLSVRMGDVKSFNTGRSEIKSNSNRVIGNEYKEVIGNRGRSVVNLRTIESREVITDWINDDETDDIISLYNSSDVYIIVDDKPYPIIINNSSYIEKTINNNRVYNYTIKFDMAYEKLSI